MTQERFAEALDISVESVRQYESDKIMPSDDVVTRMVEISGQPVIGYWHLLNKSRVAADILPDVQECSLEQAVIKLLCRIRQFAENNNTNRLMDISEDGTPAKPCIRCIRPVGFCRRCTNRGLTMADIIHKPTRSEFKRMAVQLGYEQVVRCKDCKYSYEDIDGLTCVYGPCVDCTVPEDFYCKYGEREEE